MKEEKLEKIASENSLLITQVNKYMSDNDIKSVRELFNKLKDKYYEASRIRTERDKIRQDLEDLNRNFVRSDSYGDGMPRAPIDTTPGDARQILKLQLIQELEQKTIESLLFEKSLKDRTKMLVDLIEILPHYTDIMKMSYIDGLPSSKIADNLYISVSTVTMGRKRAIQDITKILKM